MSDLRRMFYNRYKTSSIFNNDTNPNNLSKNYYPSRGIDAMNDTFIPKYNIMTCKERYWHEMGYKDIDHSFFGEKNRNNLNNKINKSKIHRPSKSLKTHHSIREKRQNKDNENQNNLKSFDIMCRDMYNGYDPKKYKYKRSKSLFELNSSNILLNEKSSRQQRNFAYHISNIFFDKSKDDQNRKSYNKYKKNNNKKNNNKSYREQKSITDFEKELNERKSKFTHSRFTSDMDWKTTNTEDIHYDHDSENRSVLTDRGIRKNNFRRVNVLRREMTNDLKDKNKELNNESVKYNLLSGNDKKNIISEKVYNNTENNNKQEKNYAKKNYDYKSNQNNNKYQPTVEYYEIDIPRNYDLTDINTIRNYFTNKGLHAFKIEESPNSVTNQSGKITLRIRRDNLIDEREYNKNLNSVKNLISKKDMKLYKVEGNKAMASTIAKQRVKTPYKREALLRPSERKNLDKNNNDITNDLNSKNNTVNNTVYNTENNSIKKNYMRPLKKDYINPLKKDNMNSIKKSNKNSIKKNNKNSIKKNIRNPIKKNNKTPFKKTNLKIKK